MNTNEQNEKIAELSKKFNQWNKIMLVGMICLGASAMLEFAPLLVVGSILACVSVFFQATLRAQYQKLTGGPEDKKAKKAKKKKDK